MTLAAEEDILGGQVFERRNNKNLHPTRKSCPRTGEGSRRADVASQGRTARWVRYLRREGCRRLPPSIVPDSATWSSYTILDSSLSG